MEQTGAKYRRREIEYPVEFAMGMVFGPPGPNVYGFESLAQWANHRYGTDYTGEQLSNIQLRALHEHLLKLSGSFHDGRLEQEIEGTRTRMSRPEFVTWCNPRFNASVTDLEDGSRAKAILMDAGLEFMLAELSQLERYVLLQVYDVTWKDRLYAMDHRKDSIWTRSFAEKDPKTEYKREGFRMFDAMLKTIEDRISDIIFKVHLEAGARARNVWNVSQTSHDQVNSFAMSEQQRAAAQAPQGDQKVKQIKLEQPKVGRNDLCPSEAAGSTRSAVGRTGSSALARQGLGLHLLGSG